MFSRLSKTNDAPTPSQITTVRGVLSEIDLAIVDTSTKLDALNATVAILHEQLAQEQLRKQTYSAIVAPFRLAPDDTLMEIFQHCSCARGTLLLVCRRWHTVVLATHSLWTTIQICDMTDRDVPHLIHHYLEHAGTLPLSMTIDQGQFGHESSLDWTFLLPYLGRIRRLTVRGHASALMKLFNAEGYSCPNIDYLEVSAYGDRIVFLQQGTVFDDSLNLQHFIQDFDPNFSIVGGFASHLTTLVWGHEDPEWNGLSTPSDFLQVVRECPQLVTLSIHIGDDTPPTSGTSNITLAHLRTLVLIGDADAVLDSLTLPALQNITFESALDGNAEYIHIAPAQFLPLVERSKCEVKSMKLECVGTGQTVASTRTWAAGNIFFDWASIMSGLTSLTLCHTPLVWNEDIDNPSLSKLVYLKVTKYRGEGWPETDLTSVQHLIASYWAMQHPSVSVLKQVVIRELDLRYDAGEVFTSWMNRGFDIEHTIQPA